jgi:hypothetical protein
MRAEKVSVCDPRCLNLAFDAEINTRPSALGFEMSENHRLGLPRFFGQ